MAFTGNYVCTSFKVDLMCARHNFLLSGGSTFKIALYTNSASFTASTTAYTATNEVSGTGYTATGNTLTRVDPTSSGTTAFTDFADSTWSTSTISAARGAMIYNDTLTTPVADASVVILDFGSDKSSSAGDFTVVFPTADASNAIIRIA
jgi:hypothetical protein